MQFSAIACNYIIFTRENRVGGWFRGGSLFCVQTGVLLCPMCCRLGHGKAVFLVPVSGLSSC